MSDAVVEKLAASVADGDEVDWDASERDAGNDVERRVIRDLRLIASISAFCRTHSIDEAAPAEPEAAASTVDPPAASAPPASLGHWGAFELLQKMGEGAFGDVYRARDALHRDVALKLLRPSTTTSAEQLKARILHEGRVLARVRHPNVVAVYGAEEHDGRVGLWMEFIAGRTLEAQLRAQGPLGGREAALVGRELCRALAAVHGAGLVHRDIKAQNVMREAGGRLVLMDFGAGQALEAEAQRASGRVTGTPLYLAPELLTGSPATVQSDIYSLGVLLYHLVTNAYPIRASTLEELRLVHRQGRRRRLTDARPDLPDDFVRAIERALDPDPQRRFESAGAFSEALSETLSDTYDIRPAGLTSSDALAAQTTPPPDRPLSWLWKRPALTLAASVLVVGLAGWAGAVWLREGGTASSTVPAAAQKLRVAIRAAADGESALSSALADQVRSHLGASPHLRVIAGPAVEALSGRPASALQQSLDADVVVEIAGRQEGSGRAATVRVIRGAAPAVLLSSHVDDRSNIQNLARDLSERVVSTLEVRDRTWKPSPRTELPLYNPDALQAFRRGEAALARGGREDVIEAARMFRNATMLAPEFVLAYAKWAEALLSIYRHNAIDGAAVFPVVQDAIAQALQRDEASGEAYAALADLQVEKDRDWSRAEATFRRAIELSPSSDYARIRFAMMLSGRGRTEEAVAETQEAQSLNPRSSALRGYAGAALHYARRYEEAARMYEGTLQLDSSYTAAWIGLCKAYTALQRFDQALEACGKVRELGAAEPTFIESQLVQVYADAGRTREARQHLQALEGLYRSQPDGDTAFWLALAHASLGEADAAFKWLDESIEKRSSRLLYARVDSRLDPIRRDPRFAQREARMDAAYK